MKVNEISITKIITLTSILSLCCVSGFTMTVEDNASEISYADFYKALEDQNDDDAVSIGSQLFIRLETKYNSDSGFQALKSKLATAEFLTKRMLEQLRKATQKSISTIGDELFGKSNKNRKDTFSLAPAKAFYDTTAKIFVQSVRIDNLETEEKKFLAKFYDLRLRLLVGSIAKGGQALVISDPSFRNTHHYVLVLPLLHAPKSKSVNMDVLPNWMRKPHELKIFSDVCLLHYELPFQAMMFAMKSAQLQDKKFSQAAFYRNASTKAAKELPHIAVDCLQKAINSLDAEKVDEKVTLMFDIVQIWVDSGKYSLAAGEAKNISESFTQHPKTGKAIWLYYYALSRANNSDSILIDIDSAINNSRCKAYRTKLMYVKWWALRRQRDRIAEVAALEHKLLEEFGDNPMVAPILLSRATDSMAKQDYSNALQLLKQLQEKFPTTKTGQQAQKIIDKLKAMGKQK